MENAIAERLPFSGFRPSWNGRIRTRGAYRDQAGAPELETACVIVIQTGATLSRELPDEYRVLKRVFVGQDLRLIARKPVTIHVARGENLWFATSQRLDIYATGESAQQAMEEFAIHLLYFYRHYQELDSSEAGKGALKLKRVFGDSFIEASA